MLIDNMNKQTSEMATVYSQELEEVERAYLVDELWISRKVS